MSSKAKKSGKLSDDKRSYKYNPDWERQTWAKGKYYFFLSQLFHHVN